ncbi:MAG: leucine-rich repeat domain-containing protein [Blautia sp.]|uniref:leucine-rich repeat domain-containing protein n=2 Tax=Blautia sp. TaxID=1955243 RepID=UPI002A824E58|nr:leucine-rich repeat domain-containing protein [Blautia sp.]MDY4115036.1 leucine-rich repeat domain-containing protein [Blautia sp.]
MKKKQIALLLAALLCVSPAAECSAVMGAEFSSGEETADVQNTEGDAEDTAGEIADVQAEEATETAAELTESEDIWTSGEDVSDFGADEVPEMDEFTSGESDVLADAAEAKQGSGNYEVAYITEEQYHNCLQSEDRPEVEMKMVEDTTLSNALNSIEGENTGYCLVIPHDLNGEEDIVVPAGLNVFVGYSEDVKIRSITPNGNIIFWGVGNEKESIEIKEGQGTVGFRQLYTSGEIKGSGSNDTVVFYEDATLGGISGVENLHFGKDCRNVNIRGTSEFYNLYNDTGRTEEDWVVWIKMEGYSEKKVPVFHKAFDWGTGEFDGENGEHRIGQYGIGIQYVGDFEKWEMLDIGQNKVAAKFDMSDVDALGMIERFDVAVPDNDYLLDMDGKTWRPNEDNNIGIEMFQACEGMSAQEIFEAYGKREWPEGGCEGIGMVPSTALAERYMTAYQKKNNADGYYLMHIGAKAKISGTLTVPDGVNALKVEGPNNYDESTDTDHFIPVDISSVNVPAGKKLSFFKTFVKSNSMTFTGAGEAELLNARLNTNVTAEKIKIADAVVKSLDCKELTSEESVCLVVSEYLSFDKAVINPDMVIYGQPGAYLKFGEIDSTGYSQTAIPMVYLGTNGKQTAKLYIGGALKLGTYESEGETYSRNLITRLFDTKEAQTAGVPVSKDCFDPTYKYAWDEVDDNDWFFFTKLYKNEEMSLVTINSSLDEEYSINRLLAQFNFGKGADGQRLYGVVLPRYIHLDEFEGLTAGIDGNKRRLFYIDWWTNEEKVKAVEIPAYYEFSGQSLNSIASAQISTIKTQLYAGKAITPSVTVTLNGKKLKKGTDYTVSYANNTKAGSTASVIITGKGNYVGTAIQNFEIAAVPAKGKVYTVGSLKYKVTKSAYKNGTVSVYAPTKKTLTSVTVPATVKINGYTFQVTAIGNNAFSGCTKLKSVKIGSKVTSIGKQAFNGCKALTSMTISTNALKTVGSSALKGISAKAVIKVPAAKLSAYQKLLKGKGQKASVKITK